MLRSLVLTLAVLAAAPVQAQAPAPAKPSYQRPAAPGERVDIGGRRLHIQCKGSAPGPVVIFEAGLSQYTAQSTYGRAQDLIAAFAQVCTYEVRVRDGKWQLAVPDSYADRIEKRAWSVRLN